jgi:hypothetical protein
MTHHLGPLEKGQNLDKLSTTGTPTNNWTQAATNAKRSKRQKQSHSKIKMEEDDPEQHFPSITSAIRDQWQHLDKHS